MAGFFDELVRNPYMARGIYHGLLSGQGAYTQQPPPELLQALATGQVQTQAPRTGLGGALAGMGVMSPNYQVNPQSQLIQMLMLREQKRQDMMDKLQLFEHMARISSMIGGQRAAPMFSGMVQDPQVMQAISGIPAMPEERLQFQQQQAQAREQYQQQRLAEEQQQHAYQREIGEQRLGLSRIMVELAQQRVQYMQDRLTQIENKKERDVVGGQMLMGILNDKTGTHPDWQKSALMKAYMQTHDVQKAFEAALVAQPPPEDTRWFWQKWMGEPDPTAPKPSGRGTVHAAPEGPAMPPVPSAVGTPEPPVPKEDW